MSHHDGNDQVTLSKIPQISIHISDTPDSETQKEIDDWESKEKEIRLTGLLQDINERRKYANRIFWLLTAWLGLTFAVLLLQGFGKANGFFELDAKVIITLLTGTTLNIIGIFAIVANYLYKKTDVPVEAIPQKKNIRKKTVTPRDTKASPS